MIAQTLLRFAAAQAVAPMTDITRTDLQQHDLTAASREAIQTRVDIGPGVVSPRHRHSGEEIIYVLAGTLEYRVDGQRAAVLREGDVLFIPYGTAHSVTNIGLDTASELATYVVEKGKPLVEVVK